MSSTENAYVTAMQSFKMAKRKSSKREITLSKCQIVYKALVLAEKQQTVKHKKSKKEPQNIYRIQTNNTK